MALRELEDGLRQLQLRMGEQQLLIADQQQLITAQQAQMEVSDPLGRIEPFAGSTVPTGWLLCDGAAVSRSLYPGLFALIGTTYGAGNGTTTFNVPNARGRALVGRDASQTEFDTLGETGGAKTHTLTEAQMPSHTHGPGAGTQFSAYGAGASRQTFATGGSWWVLTSTALADVSSAATTGSRGSGAPHNNLQPYLTVNYIIRAA